MIAPKRPAPNLPLKVSARPARMHINARRAAMVPQSARSVNGGPRRRAVSRCHHVAVSATSTLQLFGALAVVATALLDPFQAAVGVGGLVRLVLLEAGVHARPSRRLVRIFRRDRRWKDGISGGPLRSCGTTGCWSGGRRSGARTRPALGFAEIAPILGAES